MNRIRLRFFYLYGAHTNIQIPLVHTSILLSLKQGKLLGALHEWGSTDTVEGELSLGCVNGSLICPKMYNVQYLLVTF